MTKSRDNATQGGLVLVNKTDFSAASTVTIDNCFNSTYQVYRIVLSCSSYSADNYMRFRLRASGTDSSAGYYGNKIFFSGAGASGTIAGYGDVNSASLGLYTVDAGTTNIYNSYIDITNPFANVITSLYTNSHGAEQNGTISTYTGANYHNVASSYDGFTLFPDAGTMTGTVRIYGYRN